MTLLLMLVGQDLGAAENCFPRGKSVTFLIPYTIGSLGNLYGRMIKTVAEEAIGSQFIPKNVPAKGGIEGMKDLYGARPSGRTLGMLNIADVVVAGLAGAVPFEVSQFSIFGRVTQTPRAVYVSKSAHAQGLTTVEAIRSRDTVRWGITGPTNFFAAAVLNHLLGIEGKYTRVGGSVQEAAKATRRGKADLLVLEVGAAKTIASGELLPIMALGPKVPNDRVFAKYKVPMVGRLIKGPDQDQALSLARITASGLIVAGPPHIPGMRGTCVEGGFKKALTGSNLRALARTAGKPIAPLNGAATRQLIQKAAPDAAQFKSIWIAALKALEK